MQRLFFLYFVMFTFLFSPFFAFALEVDYPTVLSVTINENSTFPEYARYFFNLGVAIAGALASLAIIIGAIHYLVSFSIGKITTEGKEWIKSGIFGLLILVCSYAIIYTINPDLTIFRLGTLPEPSWPPYTNGGVPPAETFTYEEIPIGTATENVLARAINCYDFDLNGNPIDGDDRTARYEPTYLNHDRIDCLIKLGEAVERKARIFTGLSDKIADMMEDCSCFNPGSGTEEARCAPKNDELASREDSNQEVISSNNLPIFGSLLAKAGSCDLSVGHSDYCKLSECGPCASREADCDNDSECASGLYCNYNVGADYGYNSDVDVCLANCHRGADPGSASYCRTDCRCAAGEGDCDTNSECQSGLTCVNNVGADYGYNSDVDVCLASCHEYPVGHRDYCTSDCKCSEGEGDCDNDSQCESGLTCVNNVGADYGFNPDVDVCLPVSGPDCKTLNATNIKVHQATLRGQVEDGGGLNCQGRFAWKETDGSWNYTSWQGTFNTGDIFEATITGLTGDTKYVFKAQCKNSKGESDGEEKTFITDVGPPEGLHAEGISESKVRIVWLTGSGADRTIIRRGGSGNCPVSRTSGTSVYDANEQAGSFHSTVDGGLSPETSYCYCGWSYGETKGDYSKRVCTDMSGDSENEETQPEGTCEEDPNCRECEDYARVGYEPESCEGIIDCDIECGCICEEPECDLCPEGYKEIIEHGKPAEGQICVDGKTYKGLDEYRSQYPLCGDLPPYPYIQCITDESSLLDIIETEVEINGTRMRIIDINVWNSLRLIDQLRYLKEKMRTISVEEDLNLLNEVENKLSSCYLAKSYQDFLKILEGAFKDNTLVIKEKVFTDPYTGEPVDISRYCTGFLYAESNCFQVCRNICPGTLESDFACYRGCPSCPDQDEACLTQQKECIKSCFDTSSCIPQEVGNFSSFTDCLVSCRNSCIEDCEQYLPSTAECGGEQEEEEEEEGAYQECLEVCNADSQCFIEYQDGSGNPVTGTEPVGTIAVSENEGKCYADFGCIGSCTDTYRSMAGFTTYPKIMERCVTKCFKCKYVSDQHAGYTQCLKEDFQTTEGHSFSSLFKIFEQTPWKLKCPNPHEKITVGMDQKICLDVYPETFKCPRSSPCPDCPCTELSRDGETIYGVTGGGCGEHVYIDDPLTFYCRKDWWEEPLQEEPLGDKWSCNKKNEIPIGETVDETEEWAEELARIVNEFITTAENMVQYLLEIGEEQGYCECDSLCDQRDELCNIPECNSNEWACSPPCNYGGPVEIPIFDPDTGEEIGSFWLCYCYQSPCQGNPCQKMINLLRGKSSSAKCPKGVTYRGVESFYEDIQDALKELKEFAFEKRSELLKKLMFSREQMDQWSKILSKETERKIQILSCSRVLDEIIPPIIDPEQNTVVIENRIFRGFCYGKRIGEFLHLPAPLLDNWFACEEESTESL